MAGFSRLSIDYIDAALAVTGLLLLQQFKTLYGAQDSWEQQLITLRFEAAKLHLVLGVVVCVELLGPSLL